MGRPSSKRFKMSESTKRGLNRMNRKDLEQLVLEKTVEVMMANEALVKMAVKVEKLTASKVKVKASALKNQISEIQEMTRRLKVLEHTKSIRIPKITRSVGLKVTCMKPTMNSEPSKELTRLVDSLKEETVHNGGSSSSVNSQLHTMYITNLI